MGVIYGYYAAADDGDAAGAIVREDGEPFGAGYDEVEVKGIDPMVDLLPAETLITGLSAETVKSDPRRGELIAVVADGEAISLSLTDTFRDALAAFDKQLLDAVAQGWAASGDFYTPPDPSDLSDFLHKLSGLAERAAGRGQRLYCWICP
ncbi:hypothetical protein [Streptomyces sp. NPDC005799]|uniref:hypothetical protein n=1 Tax=Streptomyces sp. NPDC005799 TaxID=3154678 RepID=UPI0034078EB1